DPPPRAQGGGAQAAGPGVSGTLSLTAARREFEPENVYVNTASIGLPPRRALDAVAGALDGWRTGRGEAAAYDAAITSARERFAELVGSTPARVAIGNQVSTFSALIASALPTGAVVLGVEEDFTSVLFPFMAHADRGITVRTVPLSGLL